MKLSDYITSNRNLSLPVLNLLVEEAQKRCEGKPDGYLSVLTSLRDEEIVIRVGDIEIPMEDVAAEVYRQFFDMFDTAVAEGVKAVMAGNEYEKLQDRLRDVSRELEDSLSDIEATVGRMLEKTLGPKPSAKTKVVRRPTPKSS